MRRRGRKRKGRIKKQERNEVQRCARTTATTTTTIVSSINDKKVGGRDRGGQRFKLQPNNLSTNALTTMAKRHM